MLKRLRQKQRCRPLVAACVGAALIGTALSVAGPSVAAGKDACPDGTALPPLSTTAARTYTDNNVSVFAGGDYLASGGTAESEGLHVVLGNAVFDKARSTLYPGRATSTFNVGTVGFGSGIVPAASALMLAVGKDLSVGPYTRVDVGFGAGGAVDVGGKVITAPVDSSIDVPFDGRLITNGGKLRSELGAEAVARFAKLPQVMKDVSRQLASLPTTGKTEVIDKSLRLTNDGSSPMQVYSVKAKDLTSEVILDERTVAPINAPVVVNVTGADAVSLEPVLGSLGPRLAGLPGRILWNFENVSSVKLTGGNQFAGSILAPSADLTSTASINGRVWVGKNLTMNGIGNEIHAYPWVGAPFECAPDPDVTMPGAIEITKEFQSSVPIAASELSASGTVECRINEKLVFGFPKRWSVTVKAPALSGSTQIPLVPVNATCTLTEDPQTPMESGTWVLQSVTPRHVFVKSAVTSQIRVVNLLVPPTPTPTPIPSTEPVPSEKPTPVPSTEPVPSGKPTTTPAAKPSASPTPVPGVGGGEDGTNRIGSLPGGGDPRSPSMQRAASSLAQTGENVPFWLITCAGVVLVAGAGLLVTARVRRSRRQQS